MKLFLLMLGVVVLPVLAQAQRTDESVRVKVHRSDQGNVLQVEEDVPAGDAQDLEQLMKKYGMSDELKELKPGEEVEIVIRRKTGGEATNDVTIEMDRKPTVVTPAPVVKPVTPVTPVERKKAFLGVHYEMEYGATNGSHVTKVEPGTPAYKAGLKAGDVITQADGVILRNLDDLSAVISSKKAGDKVKLTYMRDGKLNIAVVPLAERDEAFFRDNPGGQPSYQIQEEYDMEPSSGIGAGNPAARMVSPDKGGPLLGVLMLHTESVTTINGTPTASKTDGALIDDVIGNSTANEMGLKKGDKILVINGKHIKLATDVTSLIGSMKPGDKVEVEYLRDGQRRFGTGTLKPRNDFDLPIEDQIKRDIEIMGLNGASEEMLDRIQSMVDEARTRGAASSVREFRMTVKMDELSPAEAQALSAKTGQPIKAESDLDVRGLNLSPNPSTGKFHLGFELPTRGLVKIEVMDMSGNIVYSEQVGDFNGRYSKDFDISHEAKGVYVMRVMQNSKAYTRKIVTQ